MKINMEKILMAIGFVVGGIGMARTFGDLPDDVRAAKKRLMDEGEKPSEESE